MKLTKSVLEKFRKHVVAEYPKEACGVISNKKYVPCKNIAANPELDFEIDSKDLLKLGQIDAVLHSHPYKLGEKTKWDPIWPSTSDMECWMQDTTPWGIVKTDGSGISEILWMDDSQREPLLGRTFIHGVNDCYSIVRDYYHEKGIELNNYARGIEWWTTGADLYSENFAKEGFYEVQGNDLKPGDLCLFQVTSPVINHAAVFIGSDKIIHHLFHRLSYEDSLTRWKKQIVKYIRFSQELKDKQNED